MYFCKVVFTYRMTKPFKHPLSAQICHVKIIATLRDSLIGRTAVSGSVSPGSSPGPAANEKTYQLRRVFSFLLGFKVTKIIDLKYCQSFQVDHHRHHHHHRQMG